MLVHARAFLGRENELSGWDQQANRNFWRAMAMGVPFIIRDRVLTIAGFGRKVFDADADDAWASSRQ